MLYGTVAASYCVEGFGVDALKGKTLRDFDERYDELLGIVTP